MKAIVRSTSMPISRAASWSWAVARIALPWRVLVTSQVISSSSGTVIAMMTIVLQWMVTPTRW